MNFLMIIIHVLKNLTDPPSNIPVNIPSDIPSDENGDEYLY